jgi:hypothetical protein
VTSEIDYRKFYHLEAYLFDDVRRRFSETGALSAFDFFCIVVWKANRAKSKVAQRLLEKGYLNLEPAVDALTKEIAAAESSKAKLKVLVEGWRFRLPMASAVLTVLYPDKFSVYDIRVCSEVGKFHGTQDRTDFDVLWDEYQQYITEVRKQTPPDYELRDKDRWLWGRSLYDQLNKDIRENFRQAEDENG